MQIEKPKSPFNPAIVLLILIVGVPILSLPFLAKGSRARPTEAIASSVPVSSQEQVAPADEAVDSDFEDELAVQDIPPIETELPVPEEKVTAVEDQSVAPESSQTVITDTILKSAPATLLTSFYGNVKVIGANGEVKAQKGHQILEGDTIEVGATGEAVLEIEELYVLRLKPNTKITQLQPKQGEAFAGTKRMTYRFKLDQGALLGTTKYRGDKINMLSLLVKDKTFDVQDSTFRVQLADTAPWIGVLRGSVKSGVESQADRPMVIRALEKVDLNEPPQATQVPIKVSEEEWGLLRETYEMNQKTAQQEAAQIDLSKKAGDFFEYVFDHGTFYTEDVGYTVRDFYEDKNSGEVYLEAEYDVFPANSFVGLYVLTRDLDARNYGGIKFDVRRKPDEGYPDRFYLEIKSKGQIIHRFEITDIKPEWGSRQVDFFTPVSTPITEVTIVFLNESIGQTKKGYIQMRNLQMIPLTNDQKAQRDQAQKNPAPAARGMKTLPSAPASLKQAIVTTPLKKAKTVEIQDDEAQPVPYKSDESRKVADEVPKVVSFADLG